MQYMFLSHFLCLLSFQIESVIPAVTKPVDSPLTLVPPSPFTLVPPSPLPMTPLSPGTRAPSMVWERGRGDCRASLSFCQ